MIFQLAFQSNFIHIIEKVWEAGWEPTPITNIVQIFMILKNKKSVCRMKKEKFKL